MEMNGWFVLSLIFIAPTIISVIAAAIAAAEAHNKDEELEFKTAWKIFSIAGASFLCIIFCVVMGYKRPDLMQPSSNVNVEVNESQVKNAIIDVFNRMPANEKYSLLTSGN